MLIATILFSTLGSLTEFLSLFFFQCLGKAVLHDCAISLIFSIILCAISGDAICNASGFGFNGYDSHGNPKWDLCTNVNILGIEVRLFILSHLILVMLNPDISCLCKQCRSRSVAFFRSQLISICTVCH